MYHAHVPGVISLQVIHDGITQLAIHRSLCILVLGFTYYFVGVIPSRRVSNNLMEEYHMGISFFSEYAPSWRSNTTQRRPNTQIWHNHDTYGWQIGAHHKHHQKPIQHTFTTDATYKKLSQAQPTSETPATGSTADASLLQKRSSDVLDRNSYNDIEMRAPSPARSSL